MPPTRRRRCAQAPTAAAAGADSPARHVQDWRQRYPGGVPNRPDTAPAATVEACIQICKGLFHPAPDRKTSCGAAAWNGPSKQCYLKTHKAKPVSAPLS